MTAKRRVILRADGNSQIGLGHVVRSLALAAMLREEFECVFAIQAPSEELQSQIRQVCEGLIILTRCETTAERYIHELDAYLSAAEIVVLDGYTFGTSYQQSIKSKGAQLVCIDDTHAYKFVADVVVNPAGGVSEVDYLKASYTKLCAGSSYALLRHSFLAASNLPRNLPQDSLRILLNLGGADPQNLTLTLAKELRAADKAVPIEVVTGSAYRHQVELQAWLHQQQHVCLHQNLNAEQMCDLMQSCALAVTSASGVAYEYAAVGGALFVLQTAENQSALYNFLTESGVARKYQHLYQVLHPESFPTYFVEQVAVQRRYFDGKSGERLRQVFRSLSLSAALHLRKAKEEDELLLLEWANDPEVRASSFNPEPITPQNHTRWFKAVLEDPQTLLYIAEAKGKPVAHIRFNVHSGNALISYLISPAYRGQGLGHIILLKGVEQLQQHRPDALQAEGLVQQHNVASVRSFEKAGFSYGQPDTLQPAAHRFVLRLK